VTEYDETMDKLSSLFDHDKPESEPTLVQCRVLAPAGSDPADIGLNLVPLAITRARPYGSAVTPTGCASAGKSLVAAADLVESDDDRE